MSGVRFTFATAGTVIFGTGSLSEIGPIASRTGKKALITAGMHGLDILLGILADHQVDNVVFPVLGEPTVDLVVRAVSAAREQACDFVIGFGGGSALDAGKAAAALLTNPGDPVEYLEVVGAGRPIKVQPAPFLAVPTTAGTGSEVTRNAVLAAPGQQVKVSLRSPQMLASAAIVDPTLTYSLPPHITASTGMDALAQVIEPFVSARANAFTDLFCREGITRAVCALPRVYRDGQDYEAREDMAFASLMGGFALANAGLGAVHGFASPIGGMFQAPHGAVCAALLGPVVAVNARALAARAPDSPAYERYLEIARIACARQDAQVEDLTEWLENLRASLHITGLAAYGVEPQHLEALVEKGAAASSMKANPLQLVHDELLEILTRAL